MCPSRNKRVPVFLPFQDLCGGFHTFDLRSKDSALRFGVLLLHLHWLCLQYHWHVSGWENAREGTWILQKLLDQLYSVECFGTVNIVLKGELRDEDVHGFWYVEIFVVRKRFDTVHFLLWYFSNVFCLFDSETAWHSAKILVTYGDVTSKSIQRVFKVFPV